MSTIKDVANSFAEEYCSDAIYPSHLFKAILHKSVGLVHFLETDLDKDYYYLQEWADVQMQLSPRAARPLKNLDYSAEAKAVIEEAESYQTKFGMAECEPVCILASLVTPGVGFTFDQLKTLPVTPAEIEEKLALSGGATAAAADTGRPAGASTGAKGTVGKYCVDKVEEARSGKLPPVVGFENEISVIFEILGRKTKSNLLITGESGVGKTSLIHAFVKQLCDGHAPSFLEHAAAYELDLASLGADAYKGEVEDRLKNVLREIREQPNAILIIESIDKLFDKQGSLYGASSVLKQELNRGNLSLLCTASIDGYTKNIETDKEFVNKLEKITLEEPNADLCLRILKGAIGPYVEYHQLTVDEPVMVDAIRLSKRYLREKSLPDSAFDLIDRTMALVKTMNLLRNRRNLLGTRFLLGLHYLADKRMSRIEHKIIIVWHLTIETHHRVTARGSHVLHAAHELVARNDYWQCFRAEILHGNDELRLLHLRELALEDSRERVLLIG